MDINQQDYEIEQNPELQHTEGNPTVGRAMCKHDVVYKTLATVGDFECRVHFYDDDYDDSRTVDGIKRIHIVPTESFITDRQDINELFNVANHSISEGVILANPIFRRNGTAFNANKDLKDCVKYMSGVAAHYGASKDKIISIDIEDGNKVYEMSYDITSAKTYSDVSNSVYEDLANGTIGNGSLSLNYSTMLGSGPIEMSDIINTFNAGNNIDAYHRGQGIANISQNNNIPTSGAIKFSDFRNVVNKVTAEINGNWQHCQIRHEVFGSTVYTSNLPKKINVNGQIGGTTSNPAIRFNSGGQGEMILEITNTGHGFPVRSYAAGGGNGSTNTATNGGNGNNAYDNVVVNSPVKIDLPSQNRIRGGGGGGGGGGKGGNGGGGGHSGGYVCGGWFCWSSYRVCSNNGGTGGAGGNGGNGGTGWGYRWNGNNAFTEYFSSADRGGGNGSGGSGGNSRGGGTGGTGGSGGTGSNYYGSSQWPVGKGASGNGGQTGSNGAGAQAGCGGYPGGQSGKSGGSGGTGGNGKEKFTIGSGGSVTTI